MMDVDIDMDDVHEFWDNPLDLLAQVLDSIPERTARRLLAAMLRPILEPLLEHHHHHHRAVSLDGTRTGGNSRLALANEGGTSADDGSGEIPYFSTQPSLSVSLSSLAPQLSPTASKKKSRWKCVEKLIVGDESFTFETVRDGMTNPMVFLEALLPKLALTQLQTKLEPLLQQQGLEWADVVPVLEDIDTVDELQAAVADPGAFLAKVAQASSPSVPSAFAN
jgi:hypothetical protein